ncbi:MAG: hypothetical protein COV34_00435 [Candidatus Zambryskibacteria bacterium CG10_big_fil_rev_8_21_14_0_10_42_12]|uniref:Uncharacterized protein n=1 Tax=Candidatus Zambryskibacteria bacterium CG10_big_fil_rev_8_21_14_0_10_42_12 TaxID=1975115 RepID=A0A2H0QWX3_9BACT|nr:MAG: hypothetical protein COV34_00435 [Candidatus Zambryskibacteria bacterium CG10_big_fil_rev_8_21_14_0_10_42_12]
MAKKKAAGNEAVTPYNHARECRAAIWTVLGLPPDHPDALDAFAYMQDRERNGQEMGKSVVRVIQLALLGSGFATDSLRADGEVGEETQKSLRQLCKFADRKD